MEAITSGSESGPALAVNPTLDFDIEVLLAWTKTVFPMADHVVYIGKFAPFSCAYRVLTSDGNCIAVAGISGIHLSPWFLPSGTTLK